MVTTPNTVSPQKPPSPLQIRVALIKRIQIVSRGRRDKAVSLYVLFLSALSFIVLRQINILKGGYWAVSFQIWKSIQNNKSPAGRHTLELQGNGAELPRYVAIKFKFIVKVYGGICDETVEFGEMTVPTVDKPSLQHLVI